MKVVLPQNFPGRISKALDSLGFDIRITPETEPARLFGLSGAERRILFIQTEALPEFDPVHRNAFGIVALDAAARTAAGFSKSVLPHLREASEAQFQDHVTFLNGRGKIEIMHLVYENRRVRERVSIPRETNEQFLHFANSGLRELREKGILLAGFTSTLPGYLVERHPALFHFLAVVLKGSLELTLGGSLSRSVPEGSTLVIPGGTHCRYQARHPAEFLWFHIHTDALDKHIPPECGVGGPPDRTELIDYCRHFHTEARATHADRTTALARLSELIELEIRRSVSAIGMTLDEDQTTEKLRQAFRAIVENPSTATSVSQLARLAGMSASRLYRESRRRFGKPPGTMIEEIRIDQARELLLHSEHKLDRIAAMTGYSDAFSFSRAFKRITGAAPSLFRKGLGN